MCSLFEQVKLMFDNQLYSNVVTVVELFQAAGNQYNDLCGTTKFQTSMFYAKSLYQIGEYKRAIDIYKNALIQRKSLLKGKGSPKPTETSKDFPSDPDIKYEIHQCYMKIRDYDEAFSILSSITGKQRTSKVNMALAKMYQDKGNERSAITCYKEVLRECPLALEAARGLLSLGLKGVEVHSLILEPSLGIGVKFGMDWINSWIRAHAHLYAHEYKQAIQSFRQLEEKTPFSNNTSLLLSLADALYFNGDMKNCAFVLKKANDIEKLTSKGLDMFAAVLYLDGQLPELEALVNHAWFLAAEDMTAEMYVALGYLCFSVKLYHKSIHMAQKAFAKDRKSHNACMLKGNCYYETKKYYDALYQFREAVQLVPWWYEPYRGIVDCYLALGKQRDALNLALHVYKNLPHSVRAVTLYASVLMKDPALDHKALPLLKKALSIDEHYLPAIILMAELTQQESVQAAIDLLLSQVDYSPTWRLFMIIGNYYVKLKDVDKAFDFYSKALSLDTNNKEILECISKLESSASPNTSTPGMKMEGVVKIEPPFYNNSTNASDVDTTENFNDTMPEDTSDHEADMLADNETETEPGWPEILDQNTNRMSRR